MSAPLRVLQLLSCPGLGGTETFTIALAAELRRQGVVCEIVNLWHGSEMKPAAALADVPYIEMGRGVGPRSLRKLWSYMRRTEPDVICAYGLRASLAQRAVGTLARGPVLLTGLRGLDTWRRWYHVGLDRATEGVVRCFIGNSREVLKVRREREKTPSSKLELIPNAIDTVRFAPGTTSSDRSALGLPDDVVLCTTVANMRFQKGHAFLLDVIATLEKLEREVLFVWIGDDTDWPELRRRARQLGVLDRIIYLGTVVDVRPYLAVSDLFFLPSREESMPRAMMEAMSMGLPCIATSVGGVPEVLRDGVEGFLVEHGDEQLAAQRLRELVLDQNLRKPLGDAARKRIVAEFSMPQIAKRYIELFERLAR